MRTIAVVNQKGGCGKTTVSINLASTLAEAGKRTLLVDMDSQSHCAVGLAVPEEQIEQSIYDVLISKSRNEPVKLMEILWQISDRLELAPASIDLSAFEQQMNGIAERENCLKSVLEEIDGDFDYAIIDCPPAVGLLTFNALRAATDVIVPVETGYFALHGLSKQLETLSILCQRCNQHVNVNVLASMYDIRTKMGREILGELRAQFADKMFKTIVNFNTKVKEAASFGQPISEYDSASKGHMDFCALAREVISAESKQQQREIVNSLAGQLEAISASADELFKAVKPNAKTKILVNKDLKHQVPVPTDADADQAVCSLSETDTNKMLTEEKQPIEVEQPIEEEQPIEVEQPIEEEPVAEPETIKPADTDAKLSDYYGVNQIDDAIVFVTLYPRAGSVEIAGDFNGWQPESTPMEKVGSSGIWQTKMNLSPGKYHYRLVVDGKWQQDPYNENAELNPFNEFNSVLEVN